MGRVLYFFSLYWFAKAHLIDSFLQRQRRDGAHVKVMVFIFA